jgi:hypothetical protein
MSQTNTIVKMKCKAFSGDRVRENYIWFTPHGVRVYDPLAGYYTVCHCLTARQIARARSLHLC